jgi:hypothetical protein
MSAVEVDIGRLVARYSRARSQAKNFWEAYRQAARYAAPQINDFDDSPGQTKQHAVNNSQVLRSTNAFVSEVISSLTPPNTRWMELQPTINLMELVAGQYTGTDRDAMVNKLKASYETITRKFFECLDISNFYAVEDKFIRAIGIGTGCLLINEVPFGREHKNAVPFEFIYVSISNLSLDAGNNGKIYGVFRDMRVRADEITELWYDGVVPDVYNCAAADDSGGDHSHHSLVECCLYCPTGRSDGFDWVFCVFDPEHNIKIVHDRRLSYNPYIVFRWNTIDNESMGRGVILDAMGDIKQLDTLQRVFNEWIQRYALGTLLVDNVELRDLERFHNGKLEVGAAIGVHDINNIKPLPMGGNVSAQQFLLAETIQAIRQQLLDIELPVEQQMTAFETQVRAQRIMKLFSATFGRINLEFIEPIVKVCLKLMEKHGIIDIPDHIGDINQFTTKIALQSPMSKTQQLADIDAIRVALETVALIQSPIVAQQINMDRFFRFVWEGSGAPLHVLNSTQEVDENKQAAMREQIMLAHSQKFNHME